MESSLISIFQVWQFELILPKKMFLIPTSPIQRGVFTIIILVENRIITSGPRSFGFLGAKLHAFCYIFTKYKTEIIL